MARKGGTLSILWGPKRGLGVVLNIWEKIMRFMEEKPRITIILIIRVYSFSFLMFYPRFVMYQTFIML